MLAISEAFEKEFKFNNMIPASWKRFIFCGFMFFDPTKYKISKDEVIVPESKMTIKNAFGPLFFDFLWNGLFIAIMDFFSWLEQRK